MHPNQMILCYLARFLIPLLHTRFNNFIIFTLTLFAFAYFIHFQPDAPNFLFLSRFSHVFQVENIFYSIKVS